MIRTPLWSIGALAALMMASGAWAAPITWTLNASFGIQSTATGTFDFDADTGDYSNVQLTTTADSFTPDLDGYTVLSVAPFPASDANKVITDGTFAGGAFLGEITLYFDTQLTNAGGTIDLEPITGSIFNSSTGTGATLSGTVTAAPIPIPAAFWLFGSVLGLLGWMRRRQN